MSKQAEHIAQKVEEDWGPTSPAVHLFRCLVEKLDDEAVAHITPRMVERICPHVERKQILEVLPYFCGERIRIFEIVVAKIDDHGMFVPLDQEGQRAFLAGEEVIDYDTGELLAGPVSVFFRGTDHLKELLRVREG